MAEHATVNIQKQQQQQHQSDISNKTIEGPTTPSMSKGITLGLSRVIKLLDKLGNPHLAVPIIHVAGTNGKGSVCAYIDSMLRASGLRVGRFTSPHLVNVRDCITLHGKNIGAGAFQTAKHTVEMTDAEHDIKASNFELLAATAFQAFKNEDPRLDIAVVEVGMGGATDATNVCPEPLVTVITAIDMDHQAFLGNTVAEIASVKAGIIKNSRPCVLAPQAHPEAVIAVEAVAKELDAPLCYSSPATEGTNDSVVLSFNNEQISVQLPLAGSYQNANVATAALAVEVLAKNPDFRKGSTITPISIKKGIEGTRWPGRLDWIDIGGQTALVDGAHNPASIKELATYLQALQQQDTIFILALSSPRDPSTLLIPLLKNCKTGVRVIATSFSSPEGMPWVTPVEPEVLAKAARAFGVPAQSTSTVREALQNLQAFPDSRIVTCGSLYLVGDVYRILQDDQVDT